MNTFQVLRAIDRNRHRAASCNKVPHKSPGAAQAHIRHLIEIDGRDTDHLEVYKCRFCPAWHVGHKR